MLAPPLARTTAPPRALAGGLRVALVDDVVDEVSLPPGPDHAVLVAIGARYRLREALDGVWRGTSGLPGAVAVVPAGSQLAARSADGAPQRVRSLVVTVPPEALPGRGGVRGALGSRSPAVTALAGLLRDGLDDGSDTGQLSLDALGSALVLALLRDHGSGRAGGAVDGGVDGGVGAPRPGRGLGAAALARVLDHVEDHLAGPLALEELAALAHLSPFHFARVFRASTGTSPHQHVLARRAERARELLEAGRLSTAEVAAACGFTDQSHLGRVVRRRWGTTPGALRAGR